MASLPAADSPGSASADGLFAIEIQVQVPQNQKVVEQFMAYPYPVRPPRMVFPIEPLSDKEANVKRLLRSSGYTNREALNRPYPLGGWRWQFAFRNAVQKSGLGYPHSVFESWSWASNMVPYVMPEIRRSNALEAQRLQRYNKAIADFEKDHAEIEGEATRRGLDAIEIRMIKPGLGRVKLAPGNWWIVGTRKVPGLIYYWQIPLTVSDAQSVQLNCYNALLIQGGW